MDHLRSDALSGIPDLPWKLPVSVKPNKSALCSDLCFDIRRFFSTASKNNILCFRVGMAVGISCGDHGFDFVDAAASVAQLRWS